MNKKNKKALSALAVLGVLITGLIGMKNEEMNELRELIHTDIQDASLYTPQTYQSYSDSLNAALSVSDNFFSGSEEIDVAYNNLQISIEQLQFVPDKTALQELYDESLTIEQSNYIPITSELLQNGLHSARQVLEDPNAISGDVDQAIDQLQLAANALIAKPDKTQLAAVLENARNIDRAQYLALSSQALSSAIDNAFVVLDDENAVIDDVNNAVLAIEQSVDALILKPDKTMLEQLIDQANSSDEKKYTTVSYRALNQVISSVVRVYNDDNATPEQVANAESKLKEALDGLVISTHGIYKIDVYFSKEANNHVGNSWYYGAFYNDSDIDGESITARHGSSVSLYCKVVEDDSIPDVGSGYLTLVMEDGSSKSISIYVYENRGRYSGNRALWIVTASVTLVERV